MRALVAALLLGLTGCPNEETTLFARCTTELLGVGNPYHCTVSVKSLQKKDSQSLSTESRNFEAVVSGRFTVARGRVAVVLRGAKGDVASVTVTPETPGTLEATVPLNRPGSSRPSFFWLDYTPLDGSAGDVQGTVDFHDVR